MKKLVLIVTLISLCSQSVFAREFKEVLTPLKVEAKNNVQCEPSESFPMNASLKRFKKAKNRKLRKLLIGNSELIVRQNKGKIRARFKVNNEHSINITLDNGETLTTTKSIQHRYALKINNTKKGKKTKASLREKAGDCKFIYKN